MKRLFALIGITYLSVLSVVFYFENSVLTVAISAVSLALTAVFAFLKISPYKKKTALVCCITAFAACISSFCYTNFYYRPIIDNYSDKELKISAVLCDDVEKVYGYYVYQLETQTIDGDKKKLKINLYSEEELSAELYDKIDCVINTYANDSTYYKSKSIYLNAYTDENFEYSVSENDEKPLYYYAVRVRQAMKTALDTLLPSELSSLCKAIMLGDKFALSQSVRSDFYDTGVAFIVVVSGMHIAILSRFILFLVRKITKNRFVCAFSVFLTVFAFVAVTGFTSSVMRSGIMIIITFCGKIVMRHGDSLNSLGFAALLLTVTNPYAVGDIGMLLSFTATMGIVVWSRSVCRAIMAKFDWVKHFRGLLFAIVELFSVSLSAMLWILPFSVLYFGRLSPYCVVVSMLVSPAVTVLMNCALLASISFYFGILSFVAYPFALIAGIAGKYIIFIVEAFAKIPYCSVNTEKPYFYAWIFITIAVAVLGAFVKNKAVYTKFSTVFSVSVLLVGYVIFTLINVNTTRLTVQNCGYGITASVSRGNNLSVISCGGSNFLSSSAVDNVRKDGEHIDYLIIPSMNNYYGSYSKLFVNEFDVSDILVYDNECESMLLRSEQGCQVSLFGDNTRFALNLNGNTVDRVINVNGHTYQYISSGSKTVLVMPYNGNASELPENYRNADYLLINGLPKSGELLSVDSVIITCDNNAYEDIEDELYEISDNVIIVGDCEEFIIG